MLWVVAPIATVSAATSRLIGHAVSAANAGVAVSSVYVRVAIEVVVIVDRDVIVAAAAPSAVVAPTAAPRRSHS
jgi:hypothetical protein